MMPYWRLYYHLVWAVRERHPLLSLDIEPSVYRVIEAKADSLGGIVRAINGMPDHVHVIVSLPPKIAPSEFAGQAKGVSSHLINHELQTPFAWQVGFSAFTVSPNNLSKAIAYVERQKIHHAERTIIPAYERLIDLDEES